MVRKYQNTTQYPYEPASANASGSLQTALSKVTRHPTTARARRVSPRVTSDRVLTLMGSNPGSTSQNDFGRFAGSFGHQLRGPTTRPGPSTRTHRDLSSSLRLRVTSRVGSQICPSAPHTPLPGMPWAFLLHPSGHGTTSQVVPRYTELRIQQTVRLFNVFA